MKKGVIRWEGAILSSENSLQVHSKLFVPISD